MSENLSKLVCNVSQHDGIPTGKTFFFPHYPAGKLEDYPLSDIHDYSFNVFKPNFFTQRLLASTD